MTRDEFKSALFDYAGTDKARPFNDEEYNKIEYVYVWHPMIRSQGGKRQIAVIWQECGMGMILYLTPVAEEMDYLQSRRAKLRQEIEEVDRKITDLAIKYQ